MAISFQKTGSISDQNISEVVTSGNLIFTSDGNSISAYSQNQKGNMSPIWTFPSPQEEESINITNFAVGHGYVYICTGTNGNNDTHAVGHHGRHGGGNSHVSHGRHGTVSHGRHGNSGNTPGPLSLGGLAFIVLDVSSGTRIKEWDRISNIQHTDKSYIVPVNVVANKYEFVFSDNEGTVYGFDFKARKLKWFTAHPGATQGSPQGNISLGKDVAFFVNQQDQCLYGVNLASGQLRWSLPQPGGQEFSLKSPVISDSLVFVSFSDGSISAYPLNNKSNPPTASFDTTNTISLKPGETLNLPAIDDTNNLAFFNSNLALYVVELSTGKLLKQIDYLSGWDITGTIQSPLFYSDKIAALTWNQNSQTYQLFIPSSKGEIAVITMEVNLSKSKQTTYQLTCQPDPFKPAESFDLDLTQDLSIGTGSIPMPSSNGVELMKFGDSHAACFEYDSSTEVTLSNESSFGSSNFTLETWILCEKGGTVFSYSNSDNTKGLNLAVLNTADTTPGAVAGQGRIRFTMLDGTNVFQGIRSSETVICDGHWHHIAVVRDQKEMVLFLDGQSISADTLHSKSNPFDIPLNVEASNFYLGQNPNVPSDTSFTGLISEFRLWTTDRTQAQIRDRIGWALTGQEDDLIALIQTNDNDGNYEFIDRVSGNNLGTSTNITFSLTNLELNASLFPYLVKSDANTWPYSQTWILEGENPVKGQASGNGKVIGFGAGNIYYAVDEVKGHRLWSFTSAYTDCEFDIPAVCDEDSFFLSEYSASQNNCNLHKLDAKSGQLIWTQAFTADTKPAVDPIYINDMVIICMDGKTVHALSKWDGSTVWSLATNDTVIGNLALGTKDVFFVSGATIYGIPLNSTGTLATSNPSILSATLSSTPSKCIIAIDSGKLFMYDGASIATYTTGLEAIPHSKWNPNYGSLNVSEIVAMDSSAQNNLLYLASSNGYLLALDFSSGRQVFSKQISTTGSLAMTCSEDNIIYCVSAEKLEAYDPRTGDLMGVYTPPNASPEILKPYHSKGTVVFVDTNKRVHSLVFGDDICLNVSDCSSPVTFSDNSDIVVSHLDKFSFECWVNTQFGGQVFAMNNAGGQQMQFSLSIDNTGGVQANVKSSSNSYITATASSSLLLDGDWHHLAVVVKPPAGNVATNAPAQSKIVVIYMDGVQMGQLKNQSINTPLFPTSGKVEIGGISTASPFAGMIKEVRLWNESLLEIEITSRMHLKLRGNEPNLIACWDFAARSIFDCGAKRIGNKIPTAGDGNVTTIEGLSFWLCSLHLLKPKYPYMTTSCDALGVLEGNDDDVFNATIKVFNYDGSPRDNCQIIVWSSAATGVVPCPPGSQQPLTSTVTIDQTSGQSYTTDTNGTVRIQLTTSPSGESPELTVWADYMYPNERIYVAPVPEIQKHLKPILPEITSSVKLITDYDYAHGDDSTNFTKTETTINQIVLTVKDHNGNYMPGEEIEVWASDSILVEYDHAQHKLGKKTGVRFTTDAKGQVIFKIGLANSKLSSPKLIVHGLFAPRTHTFLIDPAEDANKKLAKINGDQLKGSAPLEASDSTHGSVTGFDKSTNKLTFQNKKAKFLSTKQQSSASGLATSLTTVATAVHGGVSTTPPPTDQGVAFFKAPYPSGVTENDSGTALPRRKGTFSARAACITSMPTQNFSVTVNRTSGDSGEVTGVNVDQPGSSGYQTAVNKVASLKAQQQKRMGGFFGDLWDDTGGELIKGGEDLIHGVSNVAEKAEHLVSEGIHDATAIAADGFNAVGLHQIGHLVMTTYQNVVSATGEIEHHIAVDITTLGNDALNFVIKTVDDIDPALGKIFEALVKTIEDVIKFLESIFDWQSILAISENLQSLGSGFLSDMSTNVAAFNTQISNSLSDELTKITGISPRDIPDQSAAQNSNPEISTFVKGAKLAMDASKSQWLMGKLFGGLPSPGDDHSQSTSIPDAPTKLQDKIEALGETALDEVSDKLVALAENPSALVQQPQKELYGIVEPVVSAAEGMLVDTFDYLGNVVESTISDVSTLADGDCNNAFLSAFYSFLTGGKPLTNSASASLVIAVPAHICFIISGKTFSPLTYQQIPLPGTGQGNASQAMGDSSAGAITYQILYPNITIYFGIINGMFHYYKSKVKAKANLADEDKTQMNVLVAANVALGAIKMAVIAGIEFGILKVKPDAALTIIGMMARAQLLIVSCATGILSVRGLNTGERVNFKDGTGQPLMWANVLGGAVGMIFGYISMGITANKKDKTNTTSLIFNADARIFGNVPPIAFVLISKFDFPRVYAGVVGTAALGEEACEATAIAKYTPQPA